MQLLVGRENAQEAQKNKPSHGCSSPESRSMAGHPEPSFVNFVVFCTEDGTGNHRNRFFTEGTKATKEW
jgi:hypothetical protein